MYLFPDLADAVLHAQRRAAALAVDDQGSFGRTPCVLVFALDDQTLEGLSGGFVCNPKMFASTVAVSRMLPEDQHREASAAAFLSALRPERDGAAPLSVAVATRLHQINSLDWGCTWLARSSRRRRDLHWLPQYIRPTCVDRTDDADEIGVNVAPLDAPFLPNTCVRQTTVEEGLECLRSWHCHHVCRQKIQLVLRQGDLLRDMLSVHFQGVIFGLPQ